MLVFDSLSAKRFFNGFCSIGNANKRNLVKFLRSRFSHMGVDAIGQERVFWTKVVKECDVLLKREGRHKRTVSLLQVGMLSNLIVKTFALSHEIVPLCAVAGAKETGGAGAGTSISPDGVKSV